MNKFGKRKVRGLAKATGLPVIAAYGRGGRKPFIELSCSDGSVWRINEEGDTRQIRQSNIGFTEWSGATEDGASMPDGVRFTPVSIRNRGGQETYAHNGLIVDWSHSGEPTDVVSYKVLS